MPQSKFAEMRAALLEKVQMRSDHAEIVGVVNRFAELEAQNLPIEHEKEINEFFRPDSI